MTATVFRPQGSGIRALLVLVLVAGVLGLSFALGLGEALSLPSLRTHYRELQALVAGHAVVAPVVFMGVYTLATAFSVPGAAGLTLAGGLLFGTWLGTLYAVIGAAVGAMLVYLAARTLFEQALRARAGPWLGRLEAGFRRDAFSYLLVLRLVPLFPFWLVNLVPALLGVGAGTYAVATVIGIIPGAAVYAWAGNGLGVVFQAGGTPDLSILVSSTVLGPLVGLAALSLLPVLYRQIKGRDS